MSPESHHGHSKQGDRSSRGQKQTRRFWKESSPDIQRVPPFWMLPFPFSPGHSVPLHPAGPRPSQPHSENKPHALRALGVTASCPYDHGGVGPEGFSSSGQCWWDRRRPGRTAAVMQAQPQENPRPRPLGGGQFPGLAVAGCQHRPPWPWATGLQTVQAQNEKFHLVSGKIDGRAGCKGIPASGPTQLWRNWRKSCFFFFLPPLPTAAKASPVSCAHPDTVPVRQRASPETYVLSQALSPDPHSRSLSTSSTPVEGPGL